MIKQHHDQKSRPRKRGCDKKKCRQIVNGAVSVFILKGNSILLGKQLVPFGNGSFGLPGGKMEHCEEFEMCAKREVEELTGLAIKDVEMLTVTNTIHSNFSNSPHYVTIIASAALIDPNQAPVNMETDKYEGWAWYKWGQLPKPLFGPLDELISSGFNPFLGPQFNHVRNPQAGGYPQQSYRPPRPQTSWGPPRPPPPMQQPGYGYMQPGAYPGAPPQYSQPPYGGYPPQPAAYPFQPATSGGYSSGWDQSSTQGTQQTAPGTGYDYYNQQQQPTSTPADNTGYSYGQQPPVYGSQGSYGDASYSQLATGQQQTYGQGTYVGGYGAQAPQSGYTQPTPNPQAGHHQSYGSAPAFGGTAANPTQDGSASTYGAPGGVAPAPPAVQPSPTQQGYGSQTPTSDPASYPPQGTTQPGYGAPPTSQSVYGQSASLSQASYGQSPQGQKPPASQAVYGQPPTSQAGYAASAQPGYGQVPPAQSSYAQSYQQVPPYGSAPPPSQAGYGQQQSYGDSYGSGGYSQPPAYGSEGGAAPAVTKSSPQS